MNDRIIFHDKNQRYRISCQLSGSQQELSADMGSAHDEDDAFSVDGEVYVTMCRVYFGTGDRWYTFRAQDISSLKTLIGMRRLAINSDYFNVELSCPNAGALTTLRDLLMLCRFQPILGGAQSVLEHDGA